MTADHTGPGRDRDEPEAVTPAAGPVAVVPGAQLDDERSWRAFTRRRSAFHEAGHGLLRYLLTGKPPELLSLRPGQAYQAVMIPGTGGPAWSGDFGAVANDPSILFPDDLRRHLEISICVSLAGDIAAMLAGYWGDAVYRESLDDETAAQTMAGALAALSPRHRELLAETEAKPTMESDDDAAQGGSFVLTGHDAERWAHLAWMGVLTRRLVGDHADALTRLADALVRLDVMDAETFLPIARSGRCRCHSWKNLSEGTEPVSILPKRSTKRPQPPPPDPRFRLAPTRLR